MGMNFDVFPYCDIILLAGVLQPRKPSAFRMVLYYVDCVLACSPARRPGSLDQMMWSTPGSAAARHETHINPCIRPPILLPRLPLIETRQGRRQAYKGKAEGENPQRVSTEIIIEIKQFNPGRMASHASIESIWCTH